MGRMWKDYFEHLVAVHMCGFDGIQRGNYYEKEPIRRTEDEVRGGKVRMEKLHIGMRSLERL